jgi:hypothetical protein
MLNDFKYIFVLVYKIGRHAVVNVKDECDKVVKFHDLKHEVFKVIVSKWLLIKIIKLEVGNQVILLINQLISS